MSQTVLIVTPDLNARIIATTLLESRGVDADGVDDGREACARLQKDGANIGLIVVDLDEAGSMNGWELMRRLRGRFEGPALSHSPPVLAQSKRAEPETEAFARRLGAAAFLQKPVAARQFLDTVSELLGRDEHRRRHSGSIRR